MYSLVFVGFFWEVFHALTKYNVYYKLLIVEKKECNKEETLLNIFDKIIFVEDITDSAKIYHTLKKVIDTNTIKAIHANRKEK